MITGENDLKNLLKLYNEVLNTNFNDKNLVVIQDKISSNLNKNIAEFMEKTIFLIMIIREYLKTLNII